MLTVKEVHVLAGQLRVYEIGASDHQVAHELSGESWPPKDLWNNEGWFRRR